MFERNFGNYGRSTRKASAPQPAAEWRHPNAARRMRMNEVPQSGIPGVDEWGGMGAQLSRMGQKQNDFSASTYAPTVEDGGRFMPQSVEHSTQRFF